MPFDRPLQVARAVFHVGPFAQQKVLCRWFYAEKEAPSSRVEHALLNHGELNFQNLFELRRTQRVKDHRLVDAVHELRRELAPGRTGG